MSSQSYLKDTGDDETSPPQAPLLLLGLSRTGSTSLEQALRLLGYRNVYSMDRLAIDLAPDCGTWLKAFETKYGSGKVELQDDHWVKLLGGYDVVRGAPATAFVPELISAFPNAKVILTTRDIDSWYSSYLRTIQWRANDSILCWLTLLDWQSSKQYLTLFRTAQDAIYGGDFEKNGKDVFKTHNEAVRSLVRPDRLLEYRVAQGWAPLCKFLNANVPSFEFPKGNDPDAFRKSARRRDRAVAQQILGRMAVVATGVLAIVLGLRRVFGT